MPRILPAAALFLSAGSLVLASCRRAEIRVYTVPKDPQLAPQRAVAAPAPPEEPPPRSKPNVAYTVPAGWQEVAPGEVSVAGFTIKSDAGEASVTATPLPNLQGQEAMVVNMYRQQAGLPPVEQSELDTVLQPVDIAGEQGRLLEITGEVEKKAVRMITAIAHRDGRSWFYRIAGDDAVVSAQKPAFLDFLKSVHITEPEQAAAANTSSGPPKLNWIVPQDWTVLPAGQMQVAKFAPPPRDGAKAEISVSVFPSDTGGALANINRWRKQLGLPETDQAGGASSLAPLDPNIPEAVLVSLENKQRALLGAIVPRGSKWWFYKMMGDAPAVTAARESFVAFAKTEP